MVCPQCEHVYRIKDSIPNMVSSPSLSRIPRLIFVPLTQVLSAQLLAEHEIRK